MTLLPYSYAVVAIVHYDKVIRDNLAASAMVAGQNGD